MKDRRPRKLKKVLKARKAKADAFKTVQCALATCMGTTQLALISSIPGAGVQIRAMKIFEVATNTASAVAKIMNQEPLNWRQA